jgi:DNA-binding NarL/FixJ family response regulator
MSTTSVIRVVLIEDHTIVRQGVAALLSTAPDIEVVGEAADGRTGLEVVAATLPDVVVTDLALPGLGGLEVLKQLHERPAPPACLVLSMYHDGVWVQRAMDAGASGYVLKGAQIKDVIVAIRLVAAGGVYMSPGAARASESETLSPREREVLTLIAEGHTSKEIGGILDISPRTAEHHRARLMEKLQIHDVPGLTRYAIRMGLVDQNLK